VAKLTKHSLPMTADPTLAGCAHRGTIRAAGVLVSVKDLLVPTISSYLRSALVCGDTVLISNDYLAVIWSTSQSVHADIGVAWFLVKYDHIYSTVPLSKTAQAACRELPVGSILHAYAGKTAVLSSEMWSPLPHESLLSVDALAYDDTLDLSVNIGDGIRSATNIIPSDIDVRAQLGGIKESDDLDNVGLLRRACLWFLKPVASSLHMVARSGMSVLSQISWTTNKRPKTMASEHQDVSLSSPIHDALLRVLEYLQRTAAMSMLFDISEQRQVEITKRLLKHGNLDLAIRHALPLSTGESTGRTRLRNFQFGRGANEFDPTTTQLRGQSGSISESAYQDLRDTYQEIIRRYTEQGMYEKAAFVYADLLDDVDKALDILESQGSYMLALQLAETRNARTERVVFLCLQQGDYERAFRWALMSGNTVMHRVLGKLVQIGSDVRSRELRLQWAEYLVQREAYLMAIDVLWFDPELRLHSLPLIRTMLSRSPELQLRCLARYFAIEDNPSNTLIDCLDAIANGRDTDSADIRSTLLQEFVDNYSERTQTHIRRLLRRVLADLGNEASKDLVKIVGRAIEKCGNTALNVEWRNLKPVVNSKAKSNLNAQPFNVRIDVGSGTFSSRGHSAYDFYQTRDRSTIVATGKQGICIYGPDGHLRTCLDVPASRLVVEPNEQRLLALEFDSEKSQNVVRVHVVNIHSNKYVSHTVSDIRRWAPEWDGRTWLVCTENDIQLLDILSNKVTLLMDWKSPEHIPGTITLSGSVYYVHMVGVVDEMWVIDLQNRRLAERRTFVGASKGLDTETEFGRLCALSSVYTLSRLIHSSKRTVELACHSTSYYEKSVSKSQVVQFGVMDDEQILFDCSSHFVLVAFNSVASCTIYCITSFQGSTVLSTITVNSVKIDDLTIRVHVDRLYIYCRHQLTVACVRSGKITANIYI